MTSSPIVARTELTRLLAGLPTIKQLDVALRAGKLPIHDRNRGLIEEGLARIKQEFALHDHARVQPELVKAFESIATALDTLNHIAFHDEAGRQAVWIMEEQAIWRSPINMTKYRKELGLWSQTSRFYSQLYQPSRPIRARRTARDDWLICNIYCLYKKIKQSERPGNAGPFYRFTKTCAEILGLKVSLSQDALRMRVQRLLNEQRRVIGSLGLTFEQDASRD